VNLASAGAVKALLAIRERAPATQIFGYVAAAGDRALPLGRVEPASRPLAPDAIVAALGALAPAKARVVTVGADVDALLSLRQALVRQGTSVSLAWDAKQAIDLLDMINPHAVVADLGAPQDAAAVLARVAASTPVPIVVLIEGASDVAAPLATVLNHPEVAPKIVPRGDVLAALVRAPVAVPRTSAAPARPLGARR
jgi:CheY-like chemotaxis protein